MVENPNKFSKIKETENLKKFEEEKSINSPNRLTETDIITVNDKKDINIPLKNEKFKYKDHYRNKGNIFMFLFDEDGIPKIVIGPHCKN